MANRTEYLQAFLEERLEEKHGEWWIEYRPNKGWYAVPHEPSHFHDDGFCLGSRWQVAEKTIMRAF